MHGDDGVAVLVLLELESDRDAVGEAEGGVAVE
jgi:hypothetical protein